MRGWLFYGSTLFLVEACYDKVSKQKKKEREGERERGREGERERGREERGREGERERRGKREEDSNVIVAKPKVYSHVVVGESARTQHPVTSWAGMERETEGEEGKRQCSYLSIYSNQ